MLLTYALPVYLKEIIHNRETQKNSEITDAAAVFSACQEKYILFFPFICIHKLCGLFMNKGTKVNKITNFQVWNFPDTYV